MTSSSQPTRSGPRPSSRSAVSCAIVARSAAPLVQCPPRGTWKGSGGVVYQYVDRWLGRPLVEPDVGEIVRRYLPPDEPSAPRPAGDDDDELPPWTVGSGFSMGDPQS